MYLAQSLLAHHHKVTIIEPQEALCRSLADALDVPVVCGDAISFDTLRTADVASCDAFVAVTGNDEDNLVACQIAKREFGVDRTVARAPTPEPGTAAHPRRGHRGLRHRQPEPHPGTRDRDRRHPPAALAGGGTASLNEILLPENLLLRAGPSRTSPSPATRSWSASPATPSSSSPTATRCCCLGPHPLPDPG